MSLLAQIAIAFMVFTAGVASGIRWHVGQDAIKAQEQQEARMDAARQQRRSLDVSAGRHAAQLATLNLKLGDARAQIARLSGRACLDPGTVGLLNDTGLPVAGRAAAGEPARAAAAASAASGERIATDVDVAGYIALCRTKYGELESQLNEILDREDRRHPKAAPP
jgi:hypothetical protein